MKRKIIIASIMMSLGISGVVYGNWGDALSMKGEIETGSMDYGPIKNLRIVYLGQNDYTAVPVFSDGNVFSIHLPTFNLEQYDGFCITYEVAANESNTITEIDCSASNQIINTKPLESMDFTLSWEVTSDISVSNGIIQVTQTFTLTDQSKMAYQNYLTEVSGQIEKANDEVVVTRTMLLDRKNELLKLNEELSNELGWDQYLENIPPKCYLGKQEVAYEFFHTLVIEQDYYQNINTSLFTMGLWNQSVSLNGAFQVQISALEENKVDGSLDEFIQMLEKMIASAEEKKAMDEKLNAKEDSSKENNELEEKQVEKQEEEEQEEEQVEKEQAEQSEENQVEEEQEEGEQAEEAQEEQEQSEERQAAEKQSEEKQVEEDQEEEEQTEDELEAEDSIENQTAEGKFETKESIEKENNIEDVENSNAEENNMEIESPEME